MLTSSRRSRSRWGSSSPVDLLVLHLGPCRRWGRVIKPLTRDRGLAPNSGRSGQPPRGAARHPARVTPDELAFESVSFTNQSASSRRWRNLLHHRAGPHGGFRGPSGGQDHPRQAAGRPLRPWGRILYNRVDSREGDMEGCATASGSSPRRTQLFRTSARTSLRAPRDSADAEVWRPSSARPARACRALSERGDDRAAARAGSRSRAASASACPSPAPCCGGGPARLRRGHLARSNSLTEEEISRTIGTWRAPRTR